MPTVEGITSEELFPMPCKHRTLFFGSGGYYVICSLCSCTWVAKDPMVETDTPDKNYASSAVELTNDDLRIEPTIPDDAAERILARILPEAQTMITSVVHAIVAAVKDELRKP